MLTVVGSSWFWDPVKKKPGNLLYRLIGWMQFVKFVSGVLYCRVKCSVDSDMRDSYFEAKYAGRRSL